MMHILHAQLLQLTGKVQILPHRKQKPEKNLAHQQNQPKGPMLQLQVSELPLLRQAKVAMV